MNTNQLALFTTAEGWRQIDKIDAASLVPKVITPETVEEFQGPYSPDIIEKYEKATRENLENVSQLFENLWLPNFREGSNMSLLP